MKMILVSETILRDLVQLYREGFNDCACCPLYLDCEHEGDMGSECDDDLMRFLQSGNDYDEEPDINDDVDETGYNPYMGCCDDDC